MSASIRAPYVPYAYEMSSSLVADLGKIGNTAARYPVKVQAIWLRGVEDILSMARDRAPA
jgi:hypothetical protein